MAKFTFSNSQRIHNSLITRLIQSIINPLILFGTFCLALLSIYRSICLKLDDYFQMQNSFTQSSSNITVMDVDFTMSNNELTLNDLLQNELENYKNSTLVIIGNDINTTSEFLASQRDEISLVFNTTLFVKLNESTTITSQQSKMQEMLSSLNSTVIEALSKDKSKINDLKGQLDDAVYVGTKVDTSSLSLNYDDIQDSLKDAINNSNDLKFDDGSLVELNKTSGDFLSELNQIFRDAINEIQNFNTIIPNDKSSPSYTIGLTPSLISTNSTSSNGSSVSISSTSILHTYSKAFSFQSKINLITIGIFLLISYILIMIYQYFKFRYQLNHTVSKLADFEKSESKVDYLGVVQSTNDPVVTMITDLQSQYMPGKSKDKTDKWFWLNSYTFGNISNLPYLFMVCFVFLIMWLSLDKIKWNGDTNNGISSSTNDASYNITKCYNLANFDTMDDFDVSITIIDDYNTHAYKQFTNVSGFLQDLYEKYNITSILQISPPTNLAHHNLTSIKFQPQLQSSKLLQELNSLNFRITTKINASNFQPSNIASSVLNIITTTFIQVVKVSLAASSIAFMAILFLGFVYSFLI